MMAALVLPYMVGLPGNRVAKPWAMETAVSIEKSVTALEQAASQKDWATLLAQAQELSRGLKRLSAGPFVGSLKSGNDWAEASKLYYSMKATQAAMTELEQAIEKKNSEQFDAALEKFRKAYEPLREAARRAGER
jgi:hypothetical protein